MEEQLKDVKSVLSAIVYSSNQNEVDVLSLLRDYRKIEGRQVPYAQFGFEDAISFLKANCCDTFAIHEEYEDDRNPVLSLLEPDSIMSPRTRSNSGAVKEFRLRVLKKEIKNLVKDIPGGVRCLLLGKLYREKYGRKLNYAQFGFKSAVDIAGSMVTHGLVLESEGRRSNDYLLREPTIPQLQAELPTKWARKLRKTSEKTDTDKKSNDSKMLHVANNLSHDMTMISGEANMSLEETKTILLRISKKHVPSPQVPMRLPQKSHPELHESTSVQESASVPQESPSEPRESKSMQKTASPPQGLSQEPQESSSSSAQDQQRQPKNKKHALTEALLQALPRAPLPETAQALARAMLQAFPVELPQAPTQALVPPPQVPTIPRRDPSSQTQVHAASMSQTTILPPDAENTNPEAPLLDPNEPRPSCSFENNNQQECSANCMSLLASLPPQSLRDVRPGDVLEVSLGEVYSPSHFWIMRHNGQYLSNLFAMVQEMQKYYWIDYGDVSSVPQCAMRVGHHCACLNAITARWLRAIIVKIIDLEYVKVRYVDFGIVETVPRSSLKELLRKWGALPPQAIRARLAGVRPAGDGRRWPLPASIEFLRLVRKQILYASVHSVDHRDGILLVSLIDMSTKQNVSIGEVLIRAGHADMDDSDPLAAMENAETPNYADIQKLIIEGVPLASVESYRRHVMPYVRPAGQRRAHPAPAAAAGPAPADAAAPPELGLEYARRWLGFPAEDSSFETQLAYWSTVWLEVCQDIVAGANSGDGPQ